MATILEIGIFGFALIAVLCALLSTAVGASRGFGVAAFFLGLVLGPVGLAAVVANPGTRVKCDKCREFVERDATICPKCRTDRQAMQMPSSIFFLFKFIGLLLAFICIPFGAIREQLNIFILGWVGLASFCIFYFGEKWIP